MHDVKKVVRELTVHEWSILLKAFDEWPFAPQVCLSFVFVLLRVWPVKEFLIVFSM